MNSIILNVYCFQIIGKMQSFAESGRSVGTSATVTRITYDDFSYPLPYRSARIIVGGNDSHYFIDLNDPFYKCI